ncbi:MAG TPA: tRNA-dihydrouridine synthase family protein [Vicinamibacterales bacterium]|nr:tRNA-dihydrouridine synthase family protein [Vicinamibacterales bacterium]
MHFLDALPGSLVVAPMTKGSNLPYRRLCVELGARVLVSEMVVARRLKQRRRGEWALIRRAPEEPCFGVQLAGNRPDEMAWAAALAEARGADFVDVNLGCPIDHFTRKGLGAALARQPGRVRRNVEAMRAVVRVPVTVKIRLGWNAEKRNYLDVARAAVDGGAAAVTVHGRTREARYRHPADWDAIAEIAAALPVPVIGNGDLLYPHEIADRLATSGCQAVMVARGALIKPWIFREATTGYWDISADERLGLYRRYVALGRAHWAGRPTPETGAAADGPIDEYGRVRLREFVRWHAGFWCRYVPRRADGTWPSMQQRESAFEPRSPLEALLARSDDAALDYVTDELLNDGDLARPPAAGTGAREDDLVEAG